MRTSSRPIAKILGPGLVKRRRVKIPSERSSDGFFPLRGIWTHFMRTHLPVLASGSASRLDCSDRHQGDQEPTSRITGIDEWNEHLQSTHYDLFWYFTASRSSFAVAEPSTNIVGGRKRREIERTKVGAVTPGMYSVSSISAIGRNGMTSVTIYELHRHVSSPASIFQSPIPSYQTRMI